MLEGEKFLWEKTTEFTDVKADVVEIISSNLNFVYTLRKEVQGLRLTLPSRRTRDNPHF